MLSRIYETGKDLVRVLFYSLSYPDVSDFTKFSIYIVLTVCEKFPDHLVGLIGHKIAHVIAAKGEVKLSEDLRLILELARLHRGKRENGFQHLSHFSEPTKSMIESWNRVALHAEMEHAVVEGMQLVDKEQFDSLIFGERIIDFNRFIKLNLDRIGRSWGSSRLSGMLTLHRTKPQGAAPSKSKLR